MTNYIGDFRPGDTVRVPFTTVNTSGVAVQLSGSPTAAVYALGSASALSAGVTLAVNFGSFAGQNVITVDTSQDTVAYAQQTDFAVTITSGIAGGTGGVVVTGYTVGHYSLNNRSLRNTTSAAQMGVNVVTIGGAATVSSLALGNVNVVSLSPNAITTTGITAGAFATTVFPANVFVSSLFDATAQNAFADSLLDRTNGVETGLTPRQSLRGIAASAMGATSGALSPSFNIWGAGVSTTRISALTDASGNRTTTTLSL